MKWPKVVSESLCSFFFFAIAENYYCKMMAREVYCTSSSLRLICVLCLLITLSSLNLNGKKLSSIITNNIASSMFQRIRIDKKVTNSILTAFIISCSSYPQGLWSIRLVEYLPDVIFTGSPAYAADSADEINFTTTESVPQLTAAQLLKTDIDPKVDVLKDILFVFKLYPTYAEKKDYVSIRQSLVQ